MFRIDCLHLAGDTIDEVSDAFLRCRPKDKYGGQQNPTSNAKMHIVILTKYVSPKVVAIETPRFKYNEKSFVAVLTFRSNLVPTS